MHQQTSGFRGIKSVAKKPTGGFRFIRVRSLLVAWLLMKRGLIRLYDLRVWLACHECLSSRCLIEQGRTPTYTKPELLGLLKSGNPSRVKQSLARLEANGLLLWRPNEISVETTIAETRLEYDTDWLNLLEKVTNNRRKIPFPRRTLRHLVQSSNRTLMATVFGHLMRCLYYRRDRCISGGYCKSSWIAGVFQIDIRNIKAARKELVAVNWLHVCPANQLALNRWGLAAVINMTWDVDHDDSESPPLIEENRSKKPPLIDRKLSYSKRSINQKLETNTGVKNKTSIESTPSLKHIVIEDLCDPVRLDELYHAATQAGVLPHSESNRLAWFAAAEHALDAGKENPCGLFVSLYRRKLWHYVTHAQEDHARTKLKMLDFGEESRLPGQMCGNPPIYDNLAA
jgi:hypothetical protein